MREEYGLIDWNRKDGSQQSDVQRAQHRDTVHAYLEAHYTPRTIEEQTHCGSVKLVSYKEEDLLELLASSGVEVLSDTQRYLHLVAGRDGYVARTAFTNRLEKDGLAEAIANFCTSAPRKKTLRHSATA